MMLNTGDVGVPDRPPEIFRYGNHNHAQMARSFEPYIVAGLDDRCAWEALFTEEQRLRWFRVAYGNMTEAAPAPTLF